MSTFGDEFRAEKIDEIRSHLLRAAEAMAELDPEVDYPWWLYWCVDAWNEMMKDSSLTGIEYFWMDEREAKEQLARVDWVSGEQERQ